MVEINLVGDDVNNRKRTIWKDTSTFVGAGIVVDDVAYDTGGFLDRDYDVRSHAGVSVSIENVGANSIDYTILGATKDFVMNDLDTGLADADFTETLVAEAARAAAATGAEFKLVRDIPSITAIRIRAKETVGGSSGTARGDVKAF